MQKTYVMFFLLVLSLGFLNAQTTVYDFETLTLGNLGGQNGWVTTQHPFDGAGDMQVVANAGINGNSKCLSYGISGGGYGVDASHSISAGTFSNQLDNYEISFDIAPAVWGTNIGIGFDANLDGKISSSDLSEMSIVYNSTSTYVNVTLPLSQTAQIPTTFTGNWVHITMTISDLSSGGKLKVIEKDLVTGITRIIASNVSINATASSNNSNPDNWNMIYSHVEGAIGQIDNIKIDNNPSFCTVDFLGNNSFCANIPVEIDATAIAFGEINAITNNTVLAIPDGYPLGFVSAIEIVNSTALASEINSITINSLTHEWVSDLQLILIAPNGSEITLASHVGTDGDNFITTIFTMDALVNINAGIAPFTGDYIPSQGFSSLTGSAQGTWTLKVIDDYTGVAGTLDSWTLDVPGENSIVNYSWSTGQSGSELSQINILPVAASSVSVTVTDSNGDIASAQLDYSLLQSPDVTISGTASICENSNAVLTATAISYGYTGIGDLVVSNTNPVAITDNYSGGITSQIEIDNPIPMANELISVTINSIIHPNVSDLSLFLIAPDGSWISLAAYVGGSGDNFTETEFTGYASNTTQFGTAPFTGQFQPIDNIYNLTGSAQGAWTLKVVDNSPGEIGTLISWSLQLPNYNSIVNYSWSNGENGIDVNQITTNPSNNTLYTVVAIDANGCEGTSAFNVSVYPAPTLYISDINEICLGSDLTLSAYANADNTIPIITPETNDIPIAIPDNDTIGILSPITIEASSFFASDVVSVKIDRLDHTWDSDLKISLIAPDGSSVILAQYEGNDGHNYVNTEFSMSTANLIPASTPPFTGIYLPQEPFYDLTGSAEGVWYLKVADIAWGDQGILYSWTLNLPTENSIANYAWSSGETGSDYATIITYPTSSTTYTVTVTDVRGCVKSDLVDVTVNISVDVVITQNWGTLSSSATSGNQWYEQSIGMLVGETNQTLTPLTDGTYFCAVTDENSCYEVSNSINFIYSTIDNLNQSANVTVFPNPNNGIFNIEINSESNQVLVLELVNIQGQIVFSKELNVFSKYSESFDFSNLAPGIYTMHLTNDNLNEISKIVIQ